MPEHASRFAGLYDQQNENRIADWGGDELFTRMPSRPAVDDAPAPRFRPSLVLVDPPQERRRTAPGEEWSGPRDRRRRSAEEAMAERAERLGLSVVDEGAAGAPGDARGDHRGGDEHRGGLDADLEATIREWDGKAEVEPPAPEERAANGRRTTVITGRPERAPRPLALAPQERRRPARTPAEWIGPRPDRIVAWAFVLGLLLILIAISTADAATL